MNFFKKKPKTKKSGKNENEDDFYRPQPVSLQRNWATTNANAKKSKKSKPKQHKPNNSSNSLNRKNVPSQPINPADSKPKPQTAPKHAQSVPVQRLESEPVTSSKQAMSKQSSSEQLRHAQTVHNVYPQPTQPSQPSQPSYDEKYNHDYVPKHQHSPQRSNRLSEGASGPQTGQPVVVGDISSWKAQQQQQQPQPQPMYPSLNNNNNERDGGIPQTGHNISGIAAYNPNMPAPNVPMEESSSSEEDDALNALMNGKAFEPKPEQKEEVEEEEVKVEEPVQEEKEEQPSEPSEPSESESDSDDDGGLSDWLLSIGFKKKKLALMLHALSELGLDTMDDLEELLIDLYKNSYGKQQKQWMDKIQKDLIDQGIKYAQWIKFSTKAQTMIEEKMKQKQQSQKHGKDKSDKTQNDANDKIRKSDNSTPNGFIVMQSREAQSLEQLRNAMSVVYQGIDKLDALVLSVEKNEKLAIAACEKEFNNLLKQIEARKQRLVGSLNKVSEDKAGIVGKQNKTLRSIAAEYEESMHEFNTILANNQNIRGQNEISKRQNKLTHLVSGVLRKYSNTNMVAQCTPLIGFHCNITPIVLQLKTLGMVTWGNPPHAPRITQVSSTDWSVTVSYQTNAAQTGNKNIETDPVITYEIQCVLCADMSEVDLVRNFDESRLKSEKREKKKHKKRSTKIEHGIVTKQVGGDTHSCLLLGFVCENKDYVLRVRCQNRNGWSGFSKCVVCKTKKKRKRKAKLIGKVAVLRHRGSTQSGTPNNLLFANEKALYQSLSNQDFINALSGYKKVSQSNKRKEFTDWIIFDLGTFIELIAFRIKFDVLHYRWGNIPKLIYIDIANYDDHRYSENIIKKYKPISYDDDYHNPNDPNQMSGVLVQLRKKRLENEQVFESIWNRLAIIECKKKAGWQDFNLSQNIDESKRKGQYVRIQFVNNFDCNIEHYSKFVVEQIAFNGIIYDD